ncbi:MAG TPA: carbohydrate-binding family 9-like protein, partial [bacterium]|nr:carbohydrate-binding family 9-like protein [bacterium]
MRKTRFFIPSLVSLLGLVFLFPVLGWTLEHGSVAVNTLAIPWLKAPKDFPGTLDKGCWTEAAQTTGFLDLQGRKMAANQTRLFMFYTDDSLWAAFRCLEPENSKMVLQVKEKDGPVWRDSSVEVFLDPMQTRKEYFQFVVNPLGILYDGKNMDGTWNSKAQINSVTDEKGWTAFLRIPFADLGVTPKQGDVWVANFCRSRTIEDRTSWSRLIGSYTDPVRFGQILFAGKNFKPLQVTEIKPLRMGKNDFPVQKGAFHFRIAGNNVKFERVFSIETEGRDSCAFTLNNDEVQSLTIGLKDRDGRDLAEMYLPMESSRLSADASQLKRTVSVIKAQKMGFPEAMQQRII